MKAQIVVIGASLGGLRALQMVLGGLDKNFPVPVVVVQHRLRANSTLLSSVLQQATSLTVKEAEDRDELLPGFVYVGPGDYHLLIEGTHCGLSLEAPVNFARPSVDVLFDTAAIAYRAGVIAVVLTGNNSDGALGAARIKSHGGTVIVQDPAECEASAMPLAAMAATQVDYVLKLTEIAPKLLSCVGQLSGKMEIPNAD